MPKVSVVLPTYNGSKYLAESIESIINQSFTDWELIIINDCSTDNTLEIANSYAEKDNRIKVFTNPENLKLPNSLNEGFKRATGEYWTWTSDDNRYKPEAFERMVLFLDENVDAGLVCFDMDFIDSEGVFSSSLKLPDPSTLVNQNTIGACFMYRSSIAKKIGEYDTEMFLAEDYEYWLRFYFNSRIVHRSENLYEYRQHEASLSAIKYEKIFLQRAKVKYKYHKYIIKNIEKEYLRGYYYDLRKNGIMFTDDELNEIIIKDRFIRLWYFKTLILKKFGLNSCLHLPEGINL